MALFFGAGDGPESRIYMTTLLSLLYRLPSMVCLSEFLKDILVEDNILVDVLIDPFLGFSLLIEICIGLVTILLSPDDPASPTVTSHSTHLIPFQSLSCQSFRTVSR